MIDTMRATDGHGIFMKEAYCFGCGYKKIVPIMNKSDYCVYCKPKRKLYYRWKRVGDKIDTSEYFTKKTERHMCQGRND